MLDDVREWLATEIAPDLLADERERAALRGERVARDMGSDQRARRIPQG
jgi:hypothetical protein